MNTEILDALKQITKERNIDKKYLLEALKSALLSASKKSYGTAHNIEIEIDAETGELHISAKKTVVEKVSSHRTEIDLSSARKINPNAEIGDKIKVPIHLEDFGRNAIQTVKQIVVQRVREAERSNIYEEFYSKKGTIVSGTVSMIEHGDVYVSLNKVEALLPESEQLPRETFQVGDTVRAYVTDVEKSSKGPVVMLSRTHPNFLKCLFELEVPEISEGIIEIKYVSRDPGSRAKISMVSKDEKIDPVGSCVGVGGVRVRAIVQELNGERIDIIQWSEEPAVYVSRALSPAKITHAICDHEGKRVKVVVADDQLSLAIGKQGQNVRLAAKLTGWRIDLYTESEYKKIESKGLGSKEEPIPTHSSEAEQQNKTYIKNVVGLDKIEGVGPKLASQLMSAGFKDAMDIASATAEEIASIQGIGDKTARKLIISAEKALKQAQKQK